jgi:hypothetical protein
MDVMYSYLLSLLFPRNNPRLPAFQNIFNY